METDCGQLKRDEDRKRLYAEPERPRFDRLGSNGRRENIRVPLGLPQADVHPRPSFSGTTVFTKDDAPRVVQAPFRARNRTH